MRIQPTQGSGLTTSYDAATGSLVVANEASTPILYFRVNSKIPKDINDQHKGIYSFYDFYEVFWDGQDFVKFEGGLFADYETRLTCPKIYSMPYDIDDPSNIGNFASNIGISGQGLVYPGRYRGVDSSDGRDVYEFFRSLDPSSKILLKIDDTTSFVNGYYPATSTGNLRLDQTPVYQNKFWAKELNGAELTVGRNYIGFYVGNSFDPYHGDPESSDNRPVVTVINTVMSGGTGVTVVTDITCIGGNISATYGTFYPSEEAYIAEDTKKTFLTLSDTPDSYNGKANYYLAVDPTGSSIKFVTAPPPDNPVYTGSFTNLGDCPNSIPTDPPYGEYILVSDFPSIVFKKIHIVQGSYSIIPSSGTLQDGFYNKLVNDRPNPGPNMYYGTDAGGVKGWYPLPEI